MKRVIDLVVASEEKQPPVLEFDCRGYDGSTALVEFLKASTKKETFIAVDPDDYDYSKAFYIPPNCKVKVGSRKENDYHVVTVTGNYLALRNILLLVKYIGDTGNIGHSFEIKNNHGDKSGWDGDGADRISEIRFCGKVLPRKENTEEKKIKWAYETYRNRG